MMLLCLLLLLLWLLKVPSPDALQDLEGGDAVHMGPCDKGQNKGFSAPLPDSSDVMWYATWLSGLRIPGGRQ